MRHAFAILIPCLFLLACDDEGEKQTKVDPAFQPNWAAIEAWPPGSGDVSGAPSTDRLTTVIVLDDSVSMRDQIEDAKSAVIEAVQQLPDGTHLAVMAMNNGLVAEMAPLDEVQRGLPDALAPLTVKGSTPLGGSLVSAYRRLEQEAIRQRGFGTYRVVLTTDGAASDEDLLARALQAVVTETPVEVVTIGIGISDRHVLNMPGVVTYTGVSDVGALAEALAGSVAERTSFSPVTAFEETN
ncbi:MAG: vWA domain-containing protein [Pseudomonadota bacterium]